MLTTTSSSSTSPATPTHGAWLSTFLTSRWAKALSILLPGLFIILSDLGRRPQLLAALDKPHAAGYSATAVVSIVFWGLLIASIGDRHSRSGKALTGLFIALYGTIIGVQSAFFAFWNSYCGLESQGYSKVILWAVVGTLPLTRPIVILHLLATFVVATWFALYARRVLTLRRRLLGAVRALALATFVAMTFIPASYIGVQSSTPDVIYVHAMTELVKVRVVGKGKFSQVRPERRSPTSVPTLHAKPERPRSVLFILGESQRADVTCTEYTEPCRLATRASNRAAPHRIPLLEMRAEDSATAISVSVLWTGLPSNATREELRTAPLVWDYAQAAGYDTAYWTSQVLLQMDARLFVQSAHIDRFVTGTHLESAANYDFGASDFALSDRVLADLAKMTKPFFGVVQYSNTHQPYQVDRGDAPFQPIERVGVEARRRKYLRNYYMDTIYRTDKAIGELIEGVRALPNGEDVVIVYTADHGEGLNDPTFGHGHDLFDAQLRVPAWVDAPAGTLSPEEEQSLRAAREQRVWHGDLAATLLDLLGVWDAPELAAFRARMAGHPITRTARPEEAVAISNCSWVWQCSTINYGVMRGSRKLWANNRNTKWRCYDVASDPGEKHDLGEAACPDLVAAAAELYVAPPWEAKRPAMPRDPRPAP